MKETTLKDSFVVPSKRKSSQPSVDEKSDEDSSTSSMDEESDFEYNTDNDDESNTTLSTKSTILIPKLTDYVGQAKGVKYVVIDGTRYAPGKSFPGNVTAFEITKELILSGLNTTKDFYHHFDKRFRGRFLKWDPESKVWRLNKCKVNDQPRRKIFLRCKGIYRQ